MSCEKDDSAVHVSVNASRIRQYLDEKEWHYQLNDSGDVFMLGEQNLKYKGGTGKFFIQVCDHGALCYVILPLKAEESVRQEVAEFVTRANYGLIIGNFELDFRDGEVRYKTYTSLPKNQDDVEEEIIDRLVFVNGNMIMKYGDGLIAVMMGMKKAEEAIQEIEGS